MRYISPELKEVLSRIDSVVKVCDRPYRIRVHHSEHPPSLRYHMRSKLTVFSSYEERSSDSNVGFLKYRK